MSFNKSGSKYLRAVPCITDGKIDVYAVLDAFAVTCPARQHAIKKLLCSGIRGKGDTIQDLREAADAANRAVQMEEQRQSFSLLNTPIGSTTTYGGTPTEEFTPWVGIAKRSFIAASQCPSCYRADCAAGQYPVTKDGGCEGYISALRETSPSASRREKLEGETAEGLARASLRENMLDAKQEARGVKGMANCANFSPSECFDCYHCPKYERTKQEAPTAAVLPSTRSAAAVNCKDCFRWCGSSGLNLTHDKGCDSFQPKGVAP